VVKTGSGLPDTTAVTLRDGSVAALRLAEVSDEGAVLELLRSLSVHSRAMRFSTTAVHLPSAARTAVEHIGVIAFAPDGRCVGHSWYAPTTERQAEMAIAVADRYQRRGLGTILLRKLADVAASRSIDVLEAFVLFDNVRMTDLLRDCGIPLRTRPDREGLRFELDITQPV
jgi:N-acetylglutamate synthase-like GNAT family acetyltransferase